MLHKTRNRKLTKSVDVIKSFGTSEPVTGNWYCKIKIIAYYAAKFHDFQHRPQNLLLTLSNLRVCVKVARLSLGSKELRKQNCKSKN